MQNTVLYSLTKKLHLLTLVLGYSHGPGLSAGAGTLILEKVTPWDRAADGEHRGNDGDWPSPILHRPLCSRSLSPPTTNDVL